jgi:PBSX family phage terminase large subunit
MILSPAQAIIAKDKHRFKVINCGRRFGKTTLAVEEIKGKIAAGKTKVAYIAPTYQQARDIAWEMLKREFVGADFNESRLEIKIGNRTIVLRGWEAIETLRGQAFDFIVIDEIAMMRNFWSSWQEVIRPTLTDTQGKVMFVSTPKGFNHFYELYNLEAKDKDYRSYHFTSYDNPYLPREELEKAKQELTEDRFAQEYQADFRKTEGLVYKEFDRQRHLFTNREGISATSYFAGVDFGFTNPAAVISIKKDRDNKYYVVQEFYKTNKTDEEIAEYVAAQGFNYVYPDPEAPAAIEVLRRKGANIREVTKGKDSVKNGINRIRELFKQGRLLIHSSCENLIWELETYSYPDKKDLHNEEEAPIKENDHALDALRYAIMMQEAQTTAKAQQFYPKPFHYNQLELPTVFYSKR